MLNTPLRRMDFRTAMRGVFPALFFCFVPVLAEKSMDFPQPIFQRPEREKGDDWVITDLWGKQ
uniref:Uncharacterized protein n=1 Tax=Paracidobacterium acidisoli TaxID=2303751 RepID=A0A372IJR6_9BACT